MGFKFAFNGCCSDPALDVYWSQFRDPTDFDAGMFIESPTLFTEGGIGWNLVWEYQAKFEGVKRTQHTKNHVTGLWVDPQGYSASVFSPIVELDSVQGLNDYTVAVANSSGGVFARYRLGDTFENARDYPDQGPGISYTVLDYALVAPNRWLILYERVVNAEDRPDIPLDWEPLTTLDSRGNSYYWPATPNRAERSGQWNEWHYSYHLSERDFENRKIGEDYELSGGGYVWRNARLGSWGGDSFIAPVTAHSGRWAAYLVINWSEYGRGSLKIPPYDRPVSWGGTGDEETTYVASKEEEPPRFFQVTGGSGSVHASPVPDIDSALPDADNSIWGTDVDGSPIDAKSRIVSFQTDVHGFPWLQHQGILQQGYAAQGTNFGSLQFKAYPLNGTLSTFYGTPVVHSSPVTLIPAFGPAMYVHDNARTTKIAKWGAAKDSYYLRGNLETYHMVEQPGEVLWHVLNGTPLGMNIQSTNMDDFGVWGATGINQSGKARLWGIRRGLLSWADVSDDNKFIEATRPGKMQSVNEIDWGTIPSPKADRSSEVRNYPGHPALAHASNIQNFAPNGPSSTTALTTLGGLYLNNLHLFQITSTTSNTGETSLTIEGYYSNFKDKAGNSIFNQAQLFEIMKNSVLDNEAKHMQLEVDGYTLEKINSQLDWDQKTEVELHDWR